MDAVVLTVKTLSDMDAAMICTSMTRQGSEFQAEVRERTSSTPVAIVRDTSSPIVSWAATHSWRGMQTLEGFTSEPHRRKGLARVAAALLVADGRINPREPVAVFAPHCIEIAKNVGCRDVRLFERRGDDWVENS